MQASAALKDMSGTTASRTVYICNLTFQVWVLAGTAACMPRGYVYKASYVRLSKELTSGMCI